MATRIAILVDGSPFSEQAAKRALAVGPGEYDSVHLVGQVDKRYLEQLAASRAWVKTAVLNGPAADLLPKYMRLHHIDLLQLTTSGGDSSDRIWRVRVAKGRVRGVDSQAVVSRARAA